jgi:fucose 4-O-acetylase-like acetyltransferase
MKQVKSRVSWIDNAKFFAIACVVLGHSFSLIKGDFKGYDEINLFIVAFNMPLFALLSGVTSFKALSKISSFSDLLAYFNKISWHIGVPTVVYTLIAMAIGYGMQMRWDRCVISAALLIIVGASVYLIRFSKYSSKLQKIVNYFPYVILPVCLLNQSVWYFVYVILSFFAAVISAFISNKSEKYKRLIYCILFAIISYFIAPISPFFSTVELYLPFIAGYLFASYKGLGEVSNKTGMQLTIAVTLLAIGVFTFIEYYSILNQFYLLNLNQAFMNGQMDIFALRQISAISLSVALVIIIHLLSKSYNLISTVGAMTFGIYPIHSELIAIGRGGLLISYNAVWLKLIIVSLIALLLLSVSVALVTMFRKTDFAKLLFLGE